MSNRRRQARAAGWVATPPLLLREQPDPHASLMAALGSLAECALSYHRGDEDQALLIAALTPLEAAAVVLTAAVIEGVTEDGEDPWVTACAVLAPYIVADVDGGGVA